MLLMLALAKIGRNPDTGIGAGDVACRLIHNDTFPSWGFSIKHGATSIGERWNGWTPETGFGDPGMNSPPPTLPGAYFGVNACDSG